MKTKILAMLLIVIASQAIAQEIPVMPTPTTEHEWLAKFEGDWTSNLTCQGGPGGEPIKMTGTGTSRLIGGFFVVSDIKTDIPGGTMIAVQTIGYDPEKKKYVGTWVDSVMGRLWVYEGTLNKEKTKLSLEAEGPDMTDPTKKAMYRDSYEFKSNDTIIATSELQTPDGKWVLFSEGEMTRVKK